MNGGRCGHGRAGKSGMQTMRKKEHIRRYTDEELRAKQERGENCSDWKRAGARFPEASRAGALPATHTINRESRPMPDEERQERSGPMFTRYIGIDYSGAQTPGDSLKGIRVYEAGRDALPEEVGPPPGPKKYWTRRGLAEWLALQLEAKEPAIVGIDHGFSFPMRYFEVHRLLPDWDFFLEDFRRHWPTDGENTYVDFVRDGSVGEGASRSGSARWRRITEERVGAKSVFHFDVPGSVAKSTHSGLPWLLHLRRRFGGTIHFWPFDGWDVPHGKSVLAEVYPSLWSGRYPRMDRTPDQHDAYSVAARLREADGDGTLGGYFRPEMLPGEYGEAQLEGWILGVK